MLMKMKMGREMALNKIALPITTLNSALRFQCETNCILLCAV